MVQRRYGVEAVVAMGKKAEAVKNAEAIRGLNQPDSVIDQAVFGCADDLPHHDGSKMKKTNEINKKTISKLTRLWGSYRRKIHIKQEDIV